MMPADTTDAVPPPPRGPGVLTPFAAPPRDRDLRALWISLGVGGLVLVLCCVGGVVGVAFLLPYFDSLAKTQVAAVVTDYLTALRNDDFATARRHLCDAEQRTHPLGWFEDHYGAAPVTAFRVNPDDVRIADNITVPAQVEEGGSWITRDYLVQQDATRYVICGGVS